jgi:Zn-dependent peptidase ImmA (M78 family)
VYSEPRAHALRGRYEALFGSNEFPVPVDAIAEDLLGLHVSEGDLDGLSGYLLPAERRVVLNAADSEVRRRFTLAHEVGHWVCQCLAGRVAPIYCRLQEVSLGKDRTVEREANIFAAELLMPEDAIKAAEGSADERATVFGVSAEAMARRLYSSGLGPSPREEGVR